MASLLYLVDLSLCFIWLITKSHYLVENYLTAIPKTGNSMVKYKSEADAFGTHSLQQYLIGDDSIHQ